MQIPHDAKALVSYTFTVVFSGIIEFGVQRPSTKVYQEVRHVARSTGIKSHCHSLRQSKERWALIKANAILFRTRTNALLSEIWVSLHIRICSIPAICHGYFVFENSS